MEDNKKTADDIFNMESKATSPQHEKSDDIFNMESKATSPQHSNDKFDPFGG